jgi:hypothetical protein
MPKFTIFCCFLDSLHVNDIILKAAFLRGRTINRSLMLLLFQWILPDQDLAIQELQDHCSSAPRFNDIPTQLLLHSKIHQLQLA